MDTIASDDVTHDSVYKIQRSRGHNRKRGTTCAEIIGESESLKLCDVRKVVCMKEHGCILTPIEGIEGQSH